MDDKVRADGSAGCTGPAESFAARLLAPLDPCAVLLQEWEQAHHMVVVLCRLQQRLETRIRNALGSSDPSDGPGNGGRDTSLSAPGYHRPSAGSPARCNNAVSSTMSAAEEAALTDHQRRWDALDVEVGYSRVRAAEIEAIEAEDQILDAVADTPAQSLVGVIAKLKVIVGAGENVDDTSSFPWPQIQSVLADLKDLSDRDRHVLPRPGDSQLGGNQPGDSPGLDGETGRPRAYMSDGETAAGSRRRRG